MSKENLLNGEGIAKLKELAEKAQHAECNILSSRI